VTCRLAFLVTPPTEAEMLTVEVCPTGLVVTPKLAVIAPAATVTLAGTVATVGWLLVRPTAKPPEGAGPLRVTLPITVAPPGTLVGLRVTSRTLGVTCRLAFLIAPPVLAEMTTLEVCTTSLVITEKLAPLFPAATVTLAGTVATVRLLLLRSTPQPPVGARPFRVTWPVTVAPPGTLVGLRVTVIGMSWELSDM
jgi:hypothetical protein